MRSSLWLFLLISFAVLPTFAQTPATSPKPEEKPAAVPVKEPTKEPPKENDPFEMLQQAYYLGGQLSPMARALQMEYLVVVAQKMDHPMLKQWVTELLRQTQQLPQNDDTVRIDQAALVALSEKDPAEALLLLGQLTPLAVAAPAVGQAIFNDSNAARQIFPRYWKSARNPDINALRVAADYLGNTGWQYPFVAVGTILPDVAAEDSSAAASLFLDAMQFFQRDSAKLDGSRLAYIDLLKASKGVIPDPMIKAAITDAVERFLQDASEDAPKGTMYIGSVSTGKGTVELHSTAEESLYKLLPLVREFVPDLEKKIFEKRSALNSVVSTEGVSLPEGYIESGTIRVGTTDRQRIATAVEKTKEWSREKNIRELAQTDPETALKLAETIKDPALRGSAVAAIANGKLKETDPVRASDLLKEIGATPEKIDPKDERSQLGALVTLARTQAARKNPALWTTLNRGLDLSEELFVRDMKEFPKKDSLALGGILEMPAYRATGFGEGMSLIAIGVRSQPANTMGWLGQQHDPALKAYLLMNAAINLWSAQKE